MIYIITRNKYDSTSIFAASADKGKAETRFAELVDISQELRDRLGREGISIYNHMELLAEYRIRLGDEKWWPDEYYDIDGVTEL